MASLQRTGLIRSSDEMSPSFAQSTNCNLDGGKQISCVDWIHNNKQNKSVKPKVKICEVKIKN